MPTITFVSPGGERTAVAADGAESVMHAAAGRQVAGILGECGGTLTCATCHVFVAPEWRDRLPPMSAAEDDLLDATATERRDGSRLCCQIPVDETLDGLVLHLPDAQI